MHDATTFWLLNAGVHVNVDVPSRLQTTPDHSKLLSTIHLEFEDIVTLTIDPELKEYILSKTSVSIQLEHRKHNSSQIY